MSDVFAVGSGGTILRYDGRVWSPMTSGTTVTLNSVWGSSSSDIFAVGSGGMILHYDGVLDHRGDINNDGSVNLADAILALKVSVGIHPSASVHTTADVDGDGEIGLAEAIYAVQAAAGLR
jgi:hypothetical protein